MQKAKDTARQRAVAARLRALRLELNMEQFEIANLIGVSPQRWSNYENAKRQFDYDVAVVLCDKTRRMRGGKAITMDWLYRGILQSMVDEALAVRLKPRVREAVQHMLDAAVRRAKKPTRARRAKRQRNNDGAPA